MPGGGGVNHREDGGVSADVSSRPLLCSFVVSDSQTSAGSDHLDPAGRFGPLTRVPGLRLSPHQPRSRWDPSVRRRFSPFVIVRKKTNPSGLHANTNTGAVFLRLRQRILFRLG